MTIFKPFKKIHLGPGTDGKTVTYGPKVPRKIDFLVFIHFIHVTIKKIVVYNRHDRAIVEYLSTS